MRNDGPLGGNPSPLASRWSTRKYMNREIPSYVPPEALLHSDGQFMRAFRLRAIIHDLDRIIKVETENGKPNSEIEVKREKYTEAIKELSALRRFFDDNAGAKGKSIMRKIPFTPEQMETGAWGALIGARGVVHKQMEKEYNCRIVLAGRGITDVVKDTNANAKEWADEEAHVRITASNEKDFQAVVEKIEWILSDDPEAVQFREDNRRRTAQLEGRYDPRTWVSSTDKAKSGVGHKRERENPEEDDLDEFLSSF